MTRFLWPHTFGLVPIGILQDRRCMRPEDPIALDHLVASATKLGIVIPVIVNETYEVIDGMRRVTAARKLGHTTIPCVATGSYRTIVAHMGETFRMASEWNLPSLPPLPRAICDVINILAECHAEDVVRPERQRPRAARKGSVLATGKRMQFHDDMAALWGWTYESLRCVRTIYSLERTLGARSSATADVIRNFIASWEKDWPHGLTPCSAKTRVYHLVRRAEEGSTAPYTPRKAARTSVIAGPVTFTVARTKEQRAAFADTVTMLTGATTGLVGMTQLSPKLTTDELVGWEQQLSDIASSLRKIRATLRGVIRTRDANQEESAL